MLLREKLGALCAAAAAVPLILASLLIFYWLSSHISNTANTQLQRDARAASGLHKKRLSDLQSAAQLLAQDIVNRALVSADDLDNNAALARLQDLLPGDLNEYNLDMVIVTDPQGRVIARHNDRPGPGETLLGSENKNLLVEKVITEGAALRNSPAAATVVEPADQLSRWGLSHLAQVEKRDVDRALIQEAAAPIFRSGKFIALVLIGQMLNNHYRGRPGPSILQTSLVAEVQQTLYSGREVDAGALVALGDTVVASSVPADGSASDPLLTGAKCEPGKSEEALEAGERSYAVSWQAIKSVDGSPIGAIGVAVSAGELRKPISTLRNMLFAIGAVACLLTGAGGFLYGRSLGSRLSVLREAASRMSLGELSTPVKDPANPEEKRGWAFINRDEISGLADQLDQARESFRLAIERLRKREDFVNPFHRRQGGRDRHPSD